MIVHDETFFKSYLNRATFPDRIVLNLNKLGKKLAKKKKKDLYQTL